MQRSHKLGVGLVALAVLVSGCYGPFNLTRRLYQWNGQVGTKWEREFVFILLAWAPVYGITVLGDAVVFNSMEFWTGKNPVDAPERSRSAMPQTKRLARGDSEALLTYAEGATGASLQIEEFQGHHPAGTLRLEQRDGITVGVDAAGQLLLRAQTLPDGSVLVRDAQGRAVATYSAEQAEHFLASAHHVGSDRR